MLLFASACDDECQQGPTAYAFDEPGPWGETPEEVFGPMETPMTGTLGWVGPFNEGELDAEMAQTAVTLQLTLDKSSAAGLPNRPTGPCDGELTIDATITITTADGELDESIPIVLSTLPGAKHVTASVDLTGYDFAGTHEPEPGWATQEMLLWLSWERGETRLTGAIQASDAGLYATISVND